MSKEFDLSQIKFPDKFISSASVAKQYVDGVMMAYDKYWDMIRLMEEHLDGKKPKDPEKLKNAGRGWANNWNYNKGRAKIEKSVAENVDSVLNSLMLMTLSFKRLSESQKEDQDYAWAHVDEIRDIFTHIIPGVLNETIDREARLLSFLNTTEYSSTAWGWSAVTNDRECDWLGKAHHIRSIAFDSMAKPDKIQSYVTFDTIDAKELWQQYTEFSPSPNFTIESDTDGNEYRRNVGGWILDGLEEAIFFSYKGKFDSDGKCRSVMNSFQEILPEFLKNSSGTILNTTDVAIANIYTFELDKGSMTTTRVAYGNGWKGELSNNVVTRYGKDHSSYSRLSGMNPKYMLYQVTNDIESPDDALNLIIDSGFSTDGKITQLRGLARYAVEDSIRFNRKKNSIEDKLLFAGSPTIRKTNQAKGEVGPKLIPSQGFSIISEGYDYVPDQKPFDLSNHINSIVFDENDYRRETDHFNPAVSGKLSSRPVRSEVEVVTGEVRRMEGTKLNIKSRCYAKVFLGILKGLGHHLNKSNKSLVKEAESGLDYFKERCLELMTPFGIDDERKLKKVINLVDSITLDRAVGDPNAIIEQLQQADSPWKRLRLNRMLMLSRGFSRSEVNLLLPISETPRSMSHEARAAIENAILKDTAEVVFSEDNNHISDLNIHFPKIFSLFEMIMASQDDPVPTFNWLNRLVEHAGFHIDAILKAPYIDDAIKQKYLKAYKEALAGIQDIKPQIEEAAKRMQEEQQAAMEAQQAQQTDTPIDPKVQAKIENDRIKLANDQAIKQQRSDFRAQEMATNNEARRRQSEENHQDKRRRAEELAELKRAVKIMEASLKMTNR